MRTLLTTIALLCVGCSQGTRQWYEKSEPQTCITIDPVSKKVMLFDNNGRAVVLHNATIEKTADGWKFVVDGLNITEKSVENRQASAVQDREWFEGSAIMWKSILGEGGIAGIVANAMPGIIAKIQANPGLSQNTDMLRGLIEGAIKDGIAKKIAGQ